jgi:predicted kinase
VNRSQALLFEGQRVIVDATFIEAARRRPFFELAAQCSVPALFFQCEADEASIKARLAARRGDASDADWSVYLQAAQRQEAPRGNELRATRMIATTGDSRDAHLQAERALRDAELVK